MEIIQVRRKARPTISFQYEKDGNNSNGNKGQDPSFHYSPLPHPAWKEDWDRSLKHRLNIPPLLPSWPQCNKNKKKCQETHQLQDPWQKILGQTNDKGKQEKQTKPVAESCLYPWTKFLTNMVVILLVRKSAKNITFHGCIKALHV